MSDPTKTPLRTPCRRLGLRLSIRKKTPLGTNSVNNDVIETPGRTPKENEKVNINGIPTFHSPMNSTENISLLTPQQQSKENPNQCNSVILTKITPIIVSPMSHLVLSTGSGNKRLSLPRKNRDKLTKKRLNFVAPTTSANLNKENCNSLEHLQTSSVPLLTSSQETSDIQVELLHAEIALKRDQLAIHQKHEERVQKLQSYINTWQQGFRQALDSFKDKLNPPQDEKNILEHFQIPESVLNVIKPI